MRAPVYRSIEATNTFLGLAFPSEVLLILFIFWLGMLFGPPGTALLVTVGAAVTLRLSTLGRPPLFLQHLLLFHLRGLRTAHHFAAGARAAGQPHFPFATYAFRERTPARTASRSTRTTKERRDEA